MECEEAREIIPAFVGERDVSLTFRRHLAACRNCRAEVAHYEALLGDLGALRSVTVEPPGGLVAMLADIPASLSRIDAARVHVVRNRKAYIGGAAAAAAVALAGGAVLWRNHRAVAA